MVIRPSSGIRTSCRIILLMGVLLLSVPQASAFCNDEFNARIPITKINENAPFFYVNESYGVDFGVGVEHIVCNGSANYVCFNSTERRCFMNDTIQATIIAEGIGTNYGSIDDLEAYWDLNDTSDNAGNHDATNNGAVRTADCKVGYCYDFEVDDSDYMSTDAWTPPTDFTFMAWVKTESDTATGESIFGWTEAGNADYLRFQVRCGNDFATTWFRHTGSSNYRSWSGDTEVTDGNWHFEVMTMAGVNTPKFYVDGREESVSLDVSSGTITSHASSLPFTIGARGDVNEEMDGLIDEAFIITRVLSDAEQLAIFNNTNNDGYSSVGSTEYSHLLFIDSPTNTTYTDDGNVSVTWHNTTDYDSVWYSIDGGDNTTVTGNFSVVFNTSGSYYITVWVNDTLGTEDSMSVYFTMDFTVTINITDPVSGSVQTPPTLDIVFDYVSYLDCNTSMYSLNGSANVSTGCSNATMNVSGLASGNYTLYLYANNSEGKAASDSVNFTLMSPLINCTEPGAVVSVNFTFADEETLAALNGSAEYAITVYDGGFEYTYNLSVDSVLSFAICTYEPPWYADMILQYDGDGYSTRWYFFDNATLESGTSDITLYLLNTSSGSTVDADVQNPYGYPLPDVYVKFQKYYIDENLYRTVAMLKSDDQAEGQAFLDITNAWYKYVVTQGGVVLRTIGPSLLTDTSLVVSTATGTSYTWEDYSDGIATSCDYDEATEHVICTADDPTGLASEMCLKVEEFNVINMTLLNETCDSSTSMTLMVNVSEAASYNNTVRYTLYAVTESGDVVLEMATVSLGASVLFGLMGVFLTALIYMVGAGAGYWNPAASIVLAALGICVSVIVGFFVVELTAVGSLLLVFAIFAYKVKT